MFLKRSISVIISVMLFLVILTGCEKEEEFIIEEVPEVATTVEEDAPVSASNLSKYPSEITGGVNIKATPELYAQTDMTEPYTVNMLLIGHIPNDWDEVLEAINQYLEPFNTKVRASFLGWAEYNDAYHDAIVTNPLLDVAFTAPWCFMYSEATQKSFYSLDTQFATTYMPLTYKYQNHNSWSETTLWGETIAIPANMQAPNGKMVAIRQDIADELGIGELNTWDDYTDYLLRVANEITPETGIYAMAAAKDNSELWDQYKQQYDVMYATEHGWFKMMYRYGGRTPRSEDISLVYNTDIFKNYCYEMRKLAEAGVWSPDAIKNESITDDEAFAALQGASISWNKSIFTYIHQAEANPDIRCEAYFLTPEHIVETEAFSNNNLAILAKSNNPQRAAMVIDIMKNDTYVNHLIRLGIEGKHHTTDRDGYFSDSESAGDYPADYISLAWAVRNPDLTELNVDKRLSHIMSEQGFYCVACPTVTFIFDDANVAEQMKEVNNILDNGVRKLQLGMEADVDAAINDMLNKCYAAGLQTILDEYDSQYKEWYLTRM